ncbi:MAG: AtpZ/AtpI family protein [Candidatus Kapabacteria bacterium]|nr:AtpZ/AtpI family protein [Candidatus Kapabacteria bacterium]
MNLGWQLAITIGIMALLGWWLDKYFQTSPILIIIFSLFGIAAGLVNFFKTVLNNSKKDKGKKFD